MEKRRGKKMKKGSTRRGSSEDRNMVQELNPPATKTPKWRAMNPGTRDDRY